MVEVSPGVFQKLGGVMRVLAALIVLALASCNDPARLRTESEISAIAHDEAVDAVRPLISQLDGRIEELEQKNADLERRLDQEREFRQRMDNAIGSDFERFVQNTYARHTH